MADPDFSALLDDEAPEPVLIDGVAASYVSRVGSAAVFLLLERAEMAAVAGDDVSMSAWFDLARAAFQQILS